MKVFTFKKLKLKHSTWQKIRWNWNTFQHKFKSRRSLLLHRKTIIITKNTKSCSRNSSCIPVRSNTAYLGVIQKGSVWMKTGKYVTYIVKKWKLYTRYLYVKSFKEGYDSNIWSSDLYAYMWLILRKSLIRNEKVLRNSFYIIMQRVNALEVLFSKLHLQNHNQIIMQEVNAMEVLFWKLHLQNHNQIMIKLTNMSTWHTMCTSIYYASCNIVLEWKINSRESTP